MARRREAIATMTDYLAFAVDWNDLDRVAVYDELPLWSAMAGLLLLEHVPLRVGSRVLDLGHGTGFPLFELAQRLGAESPVVGLDPWSAPLARLRLKQRVWAVRNVRIVRGDAARMPLASGCFDLIVSNLGLNNFDDPATSMAEVRRVIAPGGTIALTTNLQGHMHEFYETFAATLRELALDDALEPLRRHIAHRATVASVRALLEGSGFLVSRVMERTALMRFANGSALLRHYFIKLGFLDGWKSVVADGDRARVFERLEANLNRRARERGDLVLSIPLAYVEGTIPA
jgi:ubiquinone/menaquinone biosynthesis C-methylase UbiE